MLKKKLEIILMLSLKLPRPLKKKYVQYVLLSCDVIIVIELDVVVMSLQVTKRSPAIQEEIDKTRKRLEEVCTCVYV